MSDYEGQKGKIRKVDLKGDSLLTFMAKKLNENNVKSNFDIFDDFMDEYYDKYFVVGTDLYEFVEKEKLKNWDSFCDLTHNEDGTISFHSIFYNGGTCLSEMIQHELKKINKK